MSFEIEIGGKKIDLPENENDKNNQPVSNQAEIDNIIRSNNTLMNNWETCKFKSEKMEYTKRGCCGSSSYQAIGYKCFKLEILDLQPLICSRCSAYQGRASE